jgi:hypothetical protein
LNSKNHTSFQPATEKQPLLPEERLFLLRIWQRKTFIQLLPYTGLLLLLLFLWTNGPENKRLQMGNAAFLQSSWILPCFFLFLFILLTLYFIRTYLKDVHPVRRDLRSGIKECIQFTPAPYQTPFFAEYYIKTPLEKLPLIRIDAETYQRITEQSTSCIVLAPNSHLVLRMELDGYDLGIAGDHKPA